VLLRGHRQIKGFNLKAPLVSRRTWGAFKLYTMDEIWKDIPGYEGQYQASTFGNIKEIETDRILSQTSYETKGHKYYKRCGFDCKGFLIHRLIALTFIPNPENKPQVDHIDFNEQNNRVDKLKWVTPKENQQHSAGRMRNKKIGGDHVRAILTNDQRDKINRLKQGGMRYTEIAYIFNVKANTLHAIAYRERKYTKRAKIIGET
jgi:hypothetical protein